MFSSGCRQEVNITWYSVIEELIKSREKNSLIIDAILHSLLNILFAELWEIIHAGG